MTKRTTKKTEAAEQPWHGTDVAAQLCRAVDASCLSFDTFLADGERIKAAKLKRKELTPEVVARAKALDRQWDVADEHRTLAMGGSWNGRKNVRRPEAPTSPTIDPETVARPEPRPEAPNPVVKPTGRRATEPNRSDKRENVRSVNGKLSAVLVDVDFKGIEVRAAVMNVLMNGPNGATGIALHYDDYFLNVSEVRLCLRELHSQNIVKRLKSGRYRLAAPNGSTFTGTKKTRTKAAPTAGSTSPKTSGRSGRSTGDGSRARSASKRPAPNRSLSWDMLFES